MNAHGTVTMMNHALIRSAHPGDAEQIARIQVASWRAAYQKILPHSYLAAMAQDRMAASILNGLLAPDSVYLIAEEQQHRAMGYICGGPERSGRQVYQAELYELYIVPEFQRRGIGKGLLWALADRLYKRKLYSLMVWVLAGNPNRRFYTKMGGLYAGTKTISFAGRKLQAAAYGWIDITLARPDRE